MAQTTAPTVYHDTHLTLEVDAHLGSGKFVEYFVDDLYFCVMVALRKKSYIKKEFINVLSMVFVASYQLLMYQAVVDLFSLLYR
jgi:hypothetical protein